MQIAFFAPAPDYLGDAFFNSFAGTLSFDIQSASPTEIVSVNAATGTEAVIAGTGLTDPNGTPSGTIASLAITDATGTPLVTLSDLGWAFDDLVRALVDRYMNGTDDTLVTLFSSSQIRVDMTAATAAVQGMVPGTRATITADGSPFGDILTGDVANDSIWGWHGDDALAGAGGNDFLSGNDGNDTLSGGDGRDAMEGGPGDDMILASGGSTASQGYGDYVRPGLGRDTVLGHAGLFAAGDGIDLSYADLSGVGGMTIRTSSDGTGTAKSGDGSADDSYTYVNYVEGSADGDAIFGGSDQGWQGFAGLGGDDTIRGGNGWDFVDYSYEGLYGGGGTGIVADLAAGTVRDTFGATDRLYGIETIRATDQPDRLSAAGQGARIQFDAGAGDDTVDGGAGNDTLEAGAGADLLRGGGGDDSLTATADALGDTLVGGGGNDWLSAGPGASLLVGQAGFDTLTGGGGADTLSGGGDDDTLTGAAGDDYLTAHAGNDRVEAGAGDDFAAGGIGADMVDGQDGQDTLLGQGGNDTLSGGAGDDALIGAGGRDALAGGSGADTLDGMAGQDTLTGGSGADLFVFRAVVHSPHDARDRIEDFAPGDILDLSAIDANSTVGNEGESAFTYVGAAYHAPGGGSLRLWFDDGAGLTIVGGDVDGDGLDDFAVELVGTHTLTAADFVF